MQIEAGKYYRTRDGRKVGPMGYYDDESLYCETDGLWRLFNILGGEHHYGMHDLDLIAEWTDEPAATPEVGTLRELNVQPGDVVVCLHEPDGLLIGDHFTIESDGRAANAKGDGFLPEYDAEFDRKYRIISRANAALPFGHARLPSGAVVDLTAITTPFGLLDADTQEALRKHGGPYERWAGNYWSAWSPMWAGDITYRVKPQPPAPVVETVTIEPWEVVTDVLSGYRITFDLIDGKPDCASIRMVVL